MNFAKKILLSCFVMLIGISAFGQKETWKTLGKVSFKKQYDEMMGLEIETPIYSESVLALQGDEIEVEGYIIPLKGKKAQSHFMFSAFPYSMCYFCGGAGPESVMQVFTKDNEMVEFTSKPIIVKGTLQLSYGDVNNMMYTLNNATLVRK